MVQPSTPHPHMALMPAESFVVRECWPLGEGFKALANTAKALNTGERN